METVDTKEDKINLAGGCGDLCTVSLTVYAPGFLALPLSIVSLVVNFSGDDVTRITDEV